MDTGLTAISEADIEKHRALAQSFITRIVVLEDSSGRSQTELAGTGRRFVSTVSTGSVRRTREVELAKTVQAVRPDFFTVPDAEAIRTSAAEFVRWMGQGESD